MTEMTLEQLAGEINTPVDRLVRQFAEAGMSKQTGDKVNEEEKKKLLSHLQAQHGAADGTPTRMTLKRSVKTTLSVAGNGGKAKEVVVEVRKTKAYVKRSPLDEQARREQEEQERIEAEQRLEAERLQREEMAKRRAEEDAKRKSADAGEKRQLRKIPTIKQNRVMLVDVPSVSFIRSVFSDLRTRLVRFLEALLTIPCFSSSRRSVSALTRLAMGSRTVIAA